jgi:hypothetical protein
VFCPLEWERAPGNPVNAASQLHEQEESWQVAMPLKTMSVEEKLQAMESLWDDLCANAESMASPAWHEDVLAKRDNRQERGEDESEDWEAAKRDIRNKIS